MAPIQGSANPKMKHQSSTKNHSKTEHQSKAKTSNMKASASSSSSGATNKNPSKKSTSAPTPDAKNTSKDACGSSGVANATTRGQGMGGVSAQTEPHGTLSEESGEDGTKDAQNENEMFVRITTHGKIRNWVSVGLKFLTENEDDPVCAKRSITLHTLPTHLSPNKVSPSTATSTSKPTTTSTTTATTTTTTAASSSSSTSLSSSVLTTPRLISVVEIIKREYVKHLEETKSVRLKGLWQYNEVGTLEGLGVGGGNEEGGESGGNEKRARDIVRALEGKHHPKQTQTPFMRITLSLVERPELEERATCQKPSIRKLSKSAKLRAKKREKKMRGGVGVVGDGQKDDGQQEVTESGEMEVDV